MLRHIEQFLQETPEVESYSRRTGAQTGAGHRRTQHGDFLVKLKRDRKRSLEQVTDRARGKIVRSEPAIDVEFPTSWKT